MFKTKWRRILWFKTNGDYTVDWLWGTKREARKYMKKLRARGICADAYLI